MENLRTNTYFKKVTTAEEQQIFEDIWFTVCEEKNFESEDFHPLGEKYLILDELGDFIGTIEISPYDASGPSTVQYYYDYMKEDRVRDNFGRVYEVDKLCLKKEYRSKGYILLLLHTVVHHSTQNNGKYYIAALESLLYQAMRRVYRLPVEPVAPRQEYEGFYLIPIIMDIPVAMSDEQLLHLVPNEVLEVFYHYSKEGIHATSSKK